MQDRQQKFERLIRLDDEEIDSDGANNNSSSDKGVCHVPMLSDREGQEDDIVPQSDLRNLFQNTKHKFDGTNLPGLSFTINGRHIHMSAHQLRYLSLLTLTFQNAALNLTMRAARSQKDRFSTSVAVTIAEIFKLVTCICLVWIEQRSAQKTFKTIKANLIDNYSDTLKVAVPSFVYYVQNNLLYVGSTHLDAATAQVTYQLKILTTAIFSVLMLNKKLGKIQWISLVALFIGVAMIETLAVGDKAPGKSSSLAQDTHKDKNHHEHLENPTLGFLAILTACCLSGFAGVYFEKILKDSAHVSLWIRNIQLSAATIPIGMLQLVIAERENIMTNGLLFGFTPLTWLCIVLQVQGGLLVAVVVKFANNILKGFATSMAIVISTVASMFLFDFNLTPTFVFGASMVIGSVMMYNRH